MGYTINFFSRFIINKKLENTIVSKLSALEKQGYSCYFSL